MRFLSDCFYFRRDSCVFRRKYSSLKGFLCLFRRKYYLWIGSSASRRNNSCWRDYCILCWKYCLFKGLCYFLRRSSYLWVDSRVFFSRAHCFFEGILALFIGSMICWMDYCFFLFSLNYYAWIDSTAFLSEWLFFEALIVFFVGGIISWNDSYVFLRNSCLWIDSGALYRTECFFWKGFLCFSLAVLSFERILLFFFPWELLVMSRASYLFVGMLVCVELMLAFFWKDSCVLFSWELLFMDSF